LEGFERVNRVLSVILFFSNAENLKRYWMNEDGCLFSKCLIQKGIEHTVYVSPGVNATFHDPAWGGRMEVLPVGDLETSVDRTLDRCEVVFVISDIREAIALVTGKNGCLPFLLTGNGDPISAIFTHIQITALSSLEVYFQESLPFHLLSILRGRSDACKGAIKDRSRRISTQIRKRGGAFIFGSGTIGSQVYAQCLRVGLNVFGFIDNDAHKQGNRLFERPILPPSALHPERDVVILASGNYSYDLFQQLQGVGFQYIQNLSEFFFAADSPSEPETCYHDDLWKNSLYYHDLYLRLADPLSRYVLESMVEYRKTFELPPLARICDRTNPQWFAKGFFVPSPKHVFVDGGAFDGDTALRFLNVNGDLYKAIHLFEADPRLAQRAKRNLKDYKHVYLHHCGLSDHRGTGSFSQTGLTDGQFVEGGGLPVEVDSLDHAVEDRITFLKLDVEGAEAHAIRGARGHIADHSPALAIAAYHKPQDLWALARQIRGVNSDYSFYLRHYTQVAYETVLYGLAKTFVPMPGHGELKGIERIP
jgi:FkbM family methyltransferase